MAEERVFFTEEQAIRWVMERCGWSREKVIERMTADIASGKLEVYDKLDDGFMRRMPLAEVAEALIRSIGGER